MSQKKKYSKAARKAATAQVRQAESLPQAGEAAARPEPVPSVPVSAGPQAALSLRDVKSFGVLPGWVLPAVLTVMLYLGLFLPTGGMSVALALFTLGLVLVFHRSALHHLRERLSVPAVALLAFFVVTGLAALYAACGGDAAGEFSKYLTSIPIALAALLWLERPQVRSVLWGLAALLTLLALLCVDSSGWGALYAGFAAVMDALGADFGAINQSVTAGRINGLYNNANVTASMFAVGGLLSIYLARTAEKKWARPAAVFLTGVLAMAFFLSMSRGAILCFGVTLIVYVLITGKEDRLSLVLFLVETIVVTVLLSAVAMRFLGDTGSFLPDLMTLLCGPAIYALDRFVGTPASARLAGKGKAIALVCGGLAVLAVVYAVAALNITGAYSFVEGQRLYRTTELPAGAYTLSVEAEGDITVSVVAVLTGEAVEDASTTLYDGPVESASFTVPEAVQQVDFSFFGKTGAVLRSAVLSDGTELPLNYPLIPAFLANRLQEGLLSGSSFSYRVLYVKDGLKLFFTRPLLGYGLGGSESWLVSVQNWYYQTKYLHNHVLQIMVDEGLLGAVPFLTALLGSAWLLLRRLRQQRGDALAAVLLACWVMMNLHSLMEINFSLRCYQVMVYTLLAVGLALYPVPLRRPAAVIRAAPGALAVISLWLAFFGITFQMHRSAQWDYEHLSAITPAQIMADFESCIKRDLYDPIDMQRSYVINGVLLDDGRYSEKIHQYAKALEDSGIYVACSTVCKSYYLPRGEYEELFACSRKGLSHLRAMNEPWNLQYELYFESLLPAMEADDFAAFVEGVQATRYMLAKAEAGGLSPIEINEKNQSYLAAFDHARMMDGERGYLYLLELVQQELEVSE